MPATYRPEDSIRETNVAFTLGVGDNLIVDRGIAIVSLNNSAVSATTDTTITVMGAVVGSEGIAVYEATVKVGNYGIVSGETGISNNVGELDLENRGIISGENEGISLYGSGKITNYGSIVSGTVDGLNSAIYLASSHTETTIINKGTIKARLEDSYAILTYGTNTASDTVINSGKIIGNVFLSGGNDTFNTAKGQVVGEIDGGAGKDTLKGSKFSDMLIGGDDNDKLTGGKSSDVFEFLPGAGRDVITDFDALGGGKNQDFLSLAVGMEYTEQSAHNGRDTILDFGDDQTLTLLHVTKADFSDADIHFIIS